MIVVDASEQRSTSTLPNLDDAVQSTILESVTGADLMLTTLKAPVSNEFLIGKHIEAGAILVQRKSGRDLASSVGERMNSSLAKMIACGTRAPLQRVLLFIGYMAVGSTLDVTINKQHTGKSFGHVQGAISWWRGRGGTYETIARSSLLQDWCDIQLGQIEERIANPVKEFLPAKPVVQQHDEFLQVLVPVKDARVTLATLPGIGAGRASLLYNSFRGNALDALCWLTDMQSAVKLKGIGAKMKQNVREYLQIPDHLRLGYAKLEIEEQQVLDTPQEVEPVEEDNDKPPWEE